MSLPAPVALVPVALAPAAPVRRDSTASVGSPPLAAQPARSSLDDTRSRLHRLASALVRTQNRRLLIEFLALRRNLR